MSSVSLTIGKEERKTSFLQIRGELCKKRMEDLDKRQKIGHKFLLFLFFFAAEAAAATRFWMTSVEKKK